MDVDALRLMGAPEADWCLPEVRGLGRDDWIPLLDRAAEVGLLTALGGGTYTIHPAVPWFFKGLFDGHFPAAAEGEVRAGASSERQATRAFVEAMGGLGNHYHNQFGEGSREVIGALAAEETNLLHARELARAGGWWDRVIRAMQGLFQLYDLTGRRAEWARLVAEIVPEFVDAATEGPIQGRDAEWNVVTQYRVRLARANLDLEEAERLQRLRVEWGRRAAETVVDRLPNGRPGLGAEPASLWVERAPGEPSAPPAPPLVAKLRRLGSPELLAPDRNQLRSLAVSLHELAEIQRERAQPACFAAYTEALALAEEIGDRQAAGICAFNLGTAFKDLLTHRDLDQAEALYRRSLELREKGDGLGRGRCVGQLGAVALERFDAAREAEEPAERLLGLLTEAAGQYFRALELLPPNAVDALAVTHNQLALTFERAGDLDRALEHSRMSLRYEEAQGNRFGAGQSRRTVARVLAQAARLPDAREYALAALRDFESYGARAGAEIDATRRLLAQIEGSQARQA